MARSISSSHTLDQNSIPCRATSSMSLFMASIVIWSHKHSERDTHTCAHTWATGAQSYREQGGAHVGLHVLVVQRHYLHQVLEGRHTHLNQHTHTHIEGLPRCKCSSKSLRHLGFTAVTMNNYSTRQVQLIELTFNWVQELNEFVYFYQNRVAAAAATTHSGIGTLCGFTHHLHDEVTLRLKDTQKNSDEHMVQAGSNKALVDPCAGV